MAMTVGHISPRLLASYPSALQYNRHATSLISGAAHKLSSLPTTQIWWPRRRGTLPITSFFKFGPKLPEIVEAGDPILYEPAAAVPVQDITSQRIQNIIEDMIAVMRAAPGVGLAAPQLGVPLQIIVLEDTKEYISYVPKEETEAQQRFPFDLLVICNPKLKEKGNKTASFFEGCLSIHGYRALVERHLEVEVTGYGQDGLPIKVEALGWQARILQHECDHLKGVLFVDKMMPKTFRTANNLRLPLPAGSPKPGVCLTTKKGTQP